MTTRRTTPPTAGITTDVEQMDATPIRRIAYTVRIVPEAAILNFIATNVGEFVHRTVRYHLHSTFAGREMVEVGRYMKALHNILWSQCGSLPYTQVEEVMHSLTEVLTESTLDTFVEIN